MSAEQISTIMNPDNRDVQIIISRNDLAELAGMLAKGSMTEWLTAQQVADRFNLPYNSVKDARWRKRVQFPTHQPGGSYSKPLFEFTEVSDWLRRQN